MVGAYDGDAGTFDVSPPTKCTMEMLDRLAGRNSVLSAIEKNLKFTINVSREFTQVLIMLTSTSVAYAMYTANPNPPACLAGFTEIRN